MHEKRASFTAYMVAFGRGLGLPELPNDPWVKNFCPPGASHLLRASEGHRAMRSLLAHASFGLVPHMSMRMAMIDRAVLKAVGEGPAQVVLLGAGLDTRALRLTDLHHARFFEVDHPNTQAAKRREIGDPPPNLSFVPVDFEVDLLPDRLARAGHDVSIPTVWIWEGVTMYLSREAIARTLDDVAALSSPGSDLLLTYIYRDAVPLGSHLAALGRNAFHFSGEYLHSWFAEGEFSALLEDRDFTVISDTNDREWARSLGVGRYFSGAFRVEHLIEARI